MTSTKKLTFSRLGDNIFQGNTAQTKDDIELSFKSNESPLKMGSINITNNPSDDYGLENYETVGIWLETSIGSQRQKYKVCRKLTRMLFFVELSSLIVLVKAKLKFYQ